MKCLYILFSLFIQEVKIQESFVNSCPSIIGIKVIDLLNLFC